MKGYQITFFTLQDRRHGGMSLPEWLVHLAGELGLRGATLFEASEGVDHRMHFHSAYFFEVSDRPAAVTMAVTEQEADALFARLEAEKVEVFYVKSAVEFGSTGAGRS
jgi:PII-like signaling protein